MLDFNFLDWLWYFIVNNIFIYTAHLEYIILQFCILYTLLLLLKNNNIFYSLFYLFTQVIYFGFILALNQTELFTGFLWTVEYVVIFVFLLMFFYINAQGEYQKYNLYFHKNSMYLLILIFIFFYPLFIIYNFKFIDNFYTIIIWDDFYENLNNFNMNDFVGLYLSYFSFNSLEYVLIALLLFIGSVLCVNLFRLTKVFKFKNYNNYLKTFKFHNIFSHATFMRKQYMHKQYMDNPAIKYFTSKYMAAKKEEDKNNTTDNIVDVDKNSTIGSIADNIAAELKKNLIKNDKKK